MSDDLKQPGVYKWVPTSTTGSPCEPQPAVNEEKPVIHMGHSGQTHFEGDGCMTLKHEEPKIDGPERTELGREYDKYNEGRRAGRVEGVASMQARVKELEGEVSRLKEDFENVCLQNSEMSKLIEIQADKIRINTQKLNRDVVARNLLLEANLSDANERWDARDRKLKWFKTLMLDLVEQFKRAEGDKPKSEQGHLQAYQNVVERLSELEAQG